MRLRLVAVSVGVVVAAVTVWIVWSVGWRDTATPITPSQAAANAVATTGVEDNDVPGTASDGADIVTTAPPVTFVAGNDPGGPGLYTYATVGFEEVDALGGARHDYPEQTFMTVQEGGCGLVVRWTALEERWDEQELCPVDSGMAVARYHSYHEWFGRSDLQEFACGPAIAAAVPAGVGTWSYECSNADRTERFEVEGIGNDTLDVSGAEVPVFHVRVTSTLTGQSEGQAQVETWYLEGSTLVVRRIVTRSSVSDSLIGSVAYNEACEINLTSAAPASG